jgi:hypothetical protein
LALVLVVVVAVTTTRVVAVADLSSLLLPSAPTGVQGVVHVTVVTEVVMH